MCVPYATVIVIKIIEILIIEGFVYRQINSNVTKTKKLGHLSYLNDKRLPNDKMIELLNDVYIRLTRLFN